MQRPRRLAGMRAPPRTASAATRCSASAATRGWTARRCATTPRVRPRCWPRTRRASTARGCNAPRPAPPPPRARRAARLELLRCGKHRQRACRRRSARHRTRCAAAVTPVPAAIPRPSALAREQPDGSADRECHGHDQHRAPERAGHREVPDQRRRWHVTEQMNGENAERHRRGALERGNDVGDGGVDRARST